MSLHLQLLVYTFKYIFVIMAILNRLYLKRDSINIWKVADYLFKKKYTENVVFRKCKYPTYGWSEEPYVATIR